MIIYSVYILYVPQVCITVLILSLMHFIFYIPLALFRLAYLILPYVVVPYETSLQILAAGFLCYTFVIPVSS